MPGLQIDRIDNGEGYEPGNCRWVTTTISNRNRSTTIYAEHKGKTLALREWSARLGIPYDRLYWRHSQGQRGDELFEKKDRRK